MIVKPSMPCPRIMTADCGLNADLRQTAGHFLTFLTLVARFMVALHRYKSIAKSSKEEARSGALWLPLRTSKPLLGAHTKFSEMIELRKVYCKRDWVFADGADFEAAISD